jgi:YHS domain-containing protein
VASLFVLGLSKLSLAMMCGEHGSSKHLTQAHSEHEHSTTESVPEQASTEAVNVGNKICPVSGEKVGEGGMEPATYEYEGKVYNFCCTACIDEFKKDPQKYIEKVEEELRLKSQDSETSHQGMHQGH